MVMFGYAEQLKNAVMISVTTNMTYSKTIVNPSTAEFFRSFFNPGHQETSSDLHCMFAWALGANTTVDWKWQIQPRGSTAWITFSTGNDGSTADPTNKVAMYNVILTSGVALPCQFKFLMSSTHSVTFSQKNYPNSGYCCIVTATGNVST